MNKNGCLTVLMAFAIVVVWAIVAGLVAWGMTVLTSYVAIGITTGVLLFLAGLPFVLMIAWGFFTAGVDALTG